MLVNRRAIAVCIAGLKRHRLSAERTDRRWVLQYDHVLSNQDGATDSTQASRDRSFFALAVNGSTRRRLKFRCFDESISITITNSRAREVLSKARDGLVNFPKENRTGVAGYPLLPPRSIETTI
jgi:hypothetical protein